MQYVALVHQPDKEKKKKDKAKAPPQKAPSEPLLEPADGSKQPPAEHSGGATVEPTVRRAETSPLLPPSLSTTVTLPEPLQPNGSGVVGSGGGGGIVGSGGGGGGLFGTTAAGTTSTTGGKTESEVKASEGGSLLRFCDRESQRLASETQRLLQCNPEHAMTVEELVVSFTEAEDPAHPQPEELSLSLHKHNVRRGGSKAPKMFQVRTYTVSVCVADVFLWC